jgi:hypothetical protein
VGCDETSLYTASREMCVGSWGEIECFWQHSYQ